MTKSILNRNRLFVLFILYVACSNKKIPEDHLAAAGFENSPVDFGASGLSEGIFVAAGSGIPHKDGSGGDIGTSGDTRVDSHQAAGSGQGEPVLNNIDSGWIATDDSAIPNESGTVPPNEVDQAAGDSGANNEETITPDGAVTDDPIDSCVLCHGDASRSNTRLNPYLNASPPVDVAGNTHTSAAGVGAHLAHLVNNSLRATALDCAECHPVPPSDPHPDGTIDFSWGSLASSGGVTPVYDGVTCTNYCHGATLDQGFETNPTWTLGASQTACGACHATPPFSLTHLTHRLQCDSCHSSVNSTGSMITNRLRHINGRIDSEDCTSCHKSEGGGGDGEGGANGGRNNGRENGGD